MKATLWLAVAVLGAALPGAIPLHHLLHFHYAPRPLLGLRPLLVPPPPQLHSPPPRPPPQPHSPPTEASTSQSPTTDRGLLAGSDQASPTTHSSQAKTSTDSRQVGSTTTYYPQAKTTTHSRQANSTTIHSRQANTTTDSDQAKATTTYFHQSTPPADTDQSRPTTYSDHSSPTTSFDRTSTTTDSEKSSASLAELLWTHGTDQAKIVSGQQHSSSLPPPKKPSTQSLEDTHSEGSSALPEYSSTYSSTSQTLNISQTPMVQQNASLETMAPASTAIFDSSLIHPESPPVKEAAPVEATQSEAKNVSSSTEYASLGIETQPATMNQKQGVVSTEAPAILDDTQTPEYELIAYQVEDGKRRGRTLVLDWPEEASTSDIRALHLALLFLGLVLLAMLGGSLLLCLQACRQRRREYRLPPEEAWEDSLRSLGTPPWLLHSSPSRSTPELSSSQASIGSPSTPGHLRVFESQDADTPNTTPVAVLSPVLEETVESTEATGAESPESESSWWQTVSRSSRSAATAHLPSTYSADSLTVPYSPNVPSPFPRQ